MVFKATGSEECNYGKNISKEKKGAQDQALGLTQIHLSKGKGATKTP